MMSNTVKEVRERRFTLLAGKRNVQNFVKGMTDSQGDYASLFVSFDNGEVHAYGSKTNAKDLTLDDVLERVQC